MKRKVGIINSGGDCPGLNTVIDAIVRSLEKKVDIYGFLRGFEGLLSNDYKKLNTQITSIYKFTGGTFLKSVNKGNFASKKKMGQIQKIPKENIDKALDNYNNLGLEALIVLGGDGTVEVAHQFAIKGVKIIGVPKSIDNDLKETDYTFGFHTAVETATQALDKLDTTSYSHDRVMILEVMGRNSGWISLYSGIAGGANIVLIPEIPFSWQEILRVIKERNHNCKKNTLIVVSEGSRALDEEIKVKQIGSKASEYSLGGVGDHIAKFLNQDPQIEARCTTLGHLQRGGSPSSFDRVLSRSFGAYAGKLFLEKKYGNMVVYKKGDVTHTSLQKCIHQVKTVDPNSDMIRVARQIGVSFGDIHTSSTRYT